MFTFKRMLAMLLLPLPLAAAERATPQLGKPADATLVSAWNGDIFPDGEGLPPGSGTAATGKQVYAQSCLACHGVDGRGDSADELAGAQHSLTDNPPDKTIGSYWPYATTVFDFIRRAMPLHAPGSLSDAQVYAVTAYLLYLGGLVKEDAVIDAQSLPKINMPNRGGFIDIYAQERQRH